MFPRDLTKVNRPGSRLLDVQELLASRCVRIAATPAARGAARARARDGTEHSSLAQLGKQKARIEAY